MKNSTKSKPIKFSKEYELGPYQINLVVSLTTNENYLNTIVSKPDGSKTNTIPDIYCGVEVSGYKSKKSGKTCILIAFENNKVPQKVWAHEALHAVIDIKNCYDLESPNNSNNEHLTYLIEYIFDKIQQTHTEYAQKIKKSGRIRTPKTNKGRV